mgnify:CR=1 FL=1
MKGYKAFDKGLVCRGKQYAENTVFEEDEAVIYKKGMHFCAEPMDVFDYYPPESEFAEVEAPDEAETDDNRKYVTKKLKVGSKISLKELIRAQIKIDLEKAKKEGNGSYAQGYSGHAAAQGNWGHAAVGGKDAIAAAFGIEGKAKACLGSWIMLAEWANTSEGWHIKTVKTAKIDGEKLKADTWYMLKNGEFEEVKE